MAARVASATVAQASPVEEDAAHVPIEAGAALAQELSRCLAQALAEERRALRVALERSHEASRDALDEELVRRHGALAAQLQCVCQAQRLRRVPECLPGMPVEGEHDDQAHSQEVSAPTDSAETDTRDGKGEMRPRLTQSLNLVPTEPHGLQVKRDAGKTAASQPTSSLKSAGNSSRRRRGSVDNRVSLVVFQEGRLGAHSGWAEFVEGARFEFVIGSLIILNGLQMALEVQHSGLILGYDLGYRGYAHQPHPWPGAEKVLAALSVFFGIIFTCELAVKMCALRSSFFKSYWNVFDLLVVLCFLLELSGLVIAGLAETTALRVARLARLLRLVRVVRQIRSFDALYLMTTAIKSSFIVLAWSCMLLFMIQVLVAFCINQLLDEFYFRADHPEEEKRAVFEYFGSFSRALLSTFEMTLANWPPVCRILVEYVNEWFMVLCLLHKLTVGFAVIGIINGVFIQETFRVAAQDDYIMMHQKESAARVHMTKMRRLFEAGDASGDGQLDKNEFLKLMNNVEVKTWLSSMGLDAGDGDALFEFMDKDKDRNVSAAELVEGVSKLKGAARSLDLMMCLERQEQLYRALRDVHPEIDHALKEQSRGPAFTSRWAPAAHGSPPSPTSVASRADLY